jgi:hypothetical protein
MLAGLASFALALLALPAVSAQTAAIQIGSATVENGQEAVVGLQALGMPEPGLGAWTVDIAYDPSVLSVVECDEDSGSVCNPNYAGTGDTIRVAGAVGAGRTGDVILASVTFACDQEGASALILTVGVLTDATPGVPRPIDAATENGVIACVAGADPTPTSSPPPPTATPTSVPTAVPTPAAPAPTVPPSPVPLLSCDDFQDQEEAQKAYDAAPADADALDDDGDGRACEGLPILSSDVAGTSDLPNTGSGSDGFVPPSFDSPYEWLAAGLVGAGLSWLLFGFLAGGFLASGRLRLWPRPATQSPAMQETAAYGRLSAAHDALSDITLAGLARPTWRRPPHA